MRRRKFHICLAALLRHIRLVSRQQPRLSPQFGCFGSATSTRPRSSFSPVRLAAFSSAASSSAGMSLGKISFLSCVGRLDERKRCPSSCRSFWMQRSI